MNRAIEVLHPGIETTIQDTGRPGYLSKGIPPCGAQDNFALRLANLLVGNPTGVPPLSYGSPGAAGLEMLLSGPSLRFGFDALISITGAEFNAKVDGFRVAQNRTLRVASGSVLEMGLAKVGVRGYLAVGGGIETPTVLGSRSTYVRGALGGVDGRALVAGDRLPVGNPGPGTGESLYQLRTGVGPIYADPAELRVTPGTQISSYTDASIAEFFAATWTMTPLSDRMGARFTGPRLQLRPRNASLSRDAGSGGADIVDDITPLGGIQTPGGNELIVIGVEIPSVGGYAKIGTVISADINRLAQIRPGRTAQFRLVGDEEAVEAGLALDRLIDAAESLEPLKS